MARYEKFNLTDKFIAGLDIRQRPVRKTESGSVEYIQNTAHDYFVQDDTISGFCVRITANSKTLYAQKKVGGKLLRYILGHWPTLSIDKAAKHTRNARDKASAALLEMGDGKDPNKKRADLINERNRLLEEKQHTFEKAALTYQNSIKEKSINTQNDVRFLIKNLTSSELFKCPCSEITPEIIQKTLGRYVERGQISTANKYYRYCRAIWNKASEKMEPQPSRNPFSEWHRRYQPPATPRKNTSLYLDTEQGNLWIKSIAEQRLSPSFATRVMADYVFLTLLWGTRRSEPLQLTEADLDFERKLLVFRRTKNQREHYLPITPLVEQLLKKRIADNRESKTKDDPSTFVFPSRMIGKSLCDSRAVLTQANTSSNLTVSLHDLRRSAAGDIAAAEDLLKVKMALNHSDKSDITLSYITDVAKLRALRPIFEKREIQLFKAAGIEDGFDFPSYKEETQNITDEMLSALSAIKSLTDDPNFKNAFLKALAESRK